jgi:type II secretory pathway pseudopilin PulG
VGSKVRTPKERAAIESRRNRMPVVLAAVAAVVILATSLPLSVLYGQHRQLSAEAAQLIQLRHQNALLAEQRQQLNSNAEVKRLARQNYQLVAPGQALYDILPAAGQATTTAPGSPSAGDPANQPLVSPSQAPNMSPDPGLPATSTASGTTGTSSTGSSPSATPAPATSHGGFWSRVRTTLEFWR